MLLQWWVSYPEMKDKSSWKCTKIEIFQDYLKTITKNINYEWHSSWIPKSCFEGDLLQPFTTITKKYYHPRKRIDVIFAHETCDLRWPLITWFLCLKEVTYSISCKWYQFLGHVQFLYPKTTQAAWASAVIAEKGCGYISHEHIFFFKSFLPCGIQLTIMGKKFVHE